MADLMRKAQIQQFVRAAYRGIDRPTGAGTPYYPPESTADLPAGALDWSLGLGNPLAYADLRPGDNVVDLGSGGGLDAILAARRVGPMGHVVGVDLLSEMTERAQRHAHQAGLENTEFLVGEMEALPLPDDSMDAVISNGAINLSARKMRVLFEAARVLRPGGLFCVSDVTVDEADLPVEVLTHPAAWSGCVSGGMAEQVFLRSLTRVGLDGIVVHERRELSVTDCSRYPLFPPALLDVMRQVIPPERQHRIALCVTVSARRRTAEVSDAGAGELIASGPEGNQPPRMAVFPGMSEQLVTFDAGARHCGDGVARDLRDWWAGLPVGTRTQVVVSDPSTCRDAPALARMLGHELERTLDVDGVTHFIVRTKGA